MEYLIILPSLFQKNKSANFDTRPWQFAKFAIILVHNKYPKSPMCPFLEIPKTCHVTLENTILSVPWQIYFLWEHGRFPFCTMANKLYVSWQFSFCSDHGKFNFFTMAIFSCYHGKFIFSYHGFLLDGPWWIIFGTWWIIFGTWLICFTNHGKFTLCIMAKKYHCKFVYFDHVKFTFLPRQICCSYYNTFVCSYIPWDFLIVTMVVLLYGFLIFHNVSWKIILQPMANLFYIPWRFSFK